MSSTGSCGGVACTRDEPSRAWDDGGVPTNLNIEIKARCPDPAAVLRRLGSLGAETQGEDRQVDTYFLVPEGRLKLRRGSIENYLIHYARADQAGPKESRVTLYETAAESKALLEVLTVALGVLVVIDKRRQISWVGNVKFHVDSVAELGSFVEIEAIDRTGEVGREALLAQCHTYMRHLDIRESDLEPRSYSDLLLDQR